MVRLPPTREHRGSQKLKCRDIAISCMILEDGISDGEGMFRGAWWWHDFRSPSKTPLNPVYVINDGPQKWNLAIVDVPAVRNELFDQFAPWKLVGKIDRLRDRASIEFADVAPFSRTNGTIFMALLLIARLSAVSSSFFLVACECWEAPSTSSAIILTSSVLQASVIWSGVIDIVLLFFLL